MKFLIRVFILQWKKNQKIIAPWNVNPKWKDPTTFVSPSFGISSWALGKLIQACFKLLEIDFAISIFVRVVDHFIRLFFGFLDLEDPQKRVRAFGG